MLGAGMEWFLNLLNVVAVQARETRTDFMCDLTDGQPLRIRQHYSALLRRRQHFNSFQATERVSRRMTTNYACMRKVCPR